MLPDPIDRPVLSAKEAFKELGIDPATGYRSIRDGTCPVEIIRVGTAIRVPTNGLRRLLQLDDMLEDEAIPLKLRVPAEG